MPRLLSRRFFTFTALGATALAPTLGMSASHATAVVEMLNKSPNDPRLRNVFEPRLMVVAQGETVRFAATDPSHDSASFDELLPAGATPWKGKISEDIEVTFDVPGFYSYKCTPHATAGMVGMVVVTGDGMMDNFEAAKGARHRGKSRKVFEEIWEEVEASGILA